MKRWLISVAAAAAVTAGSILAAGPAAAAPSSPPVHQAVAPVVKDFCSVPVPKKKVPSRPFNNLDWLRFGNFLTVVPAKESDLCPILA
ncbi:hypothetical protein NCCP1664_18910 [Zafaria cholistanensis]|uniref:Uncharacterized protein n=1 Tax=Zafaria cholistanensis TaxID=1682741 RepID=A0A5A7NRL5_9MICC|nr:hypothetical protein [Zafaria cholistanensis]GER23395.1 hypothetical protein NCCP1664_18910 [Zafaria cholistanensis]